jgi:hypothetical protein
MKTEKIIVCALVGLVVITALVYRMTRKVEVYENTVAKMQYDRAIEDNKNLQGKMDSSVAALTDSIAILNEMVADKENQLQSLKIKRNEKTNRVSNLGTVDLTKFITDLYKDSIK